MNAWLERAATGLPSKALIPAFERAFDSLWHRANETLGEVTLTAIVDRILYNATEKHPVLAGLRLGAEGLSWQDGPERTRAMTDAQLTDAIRYVLVEFLTVLGNLTADILTPALHAALSSVAPRPERDQAASRPERQAPPRSNGEDQQS